MIIRETDYSTDSACGIFGFVMTSKKKTSVIAAVTGIVFLVLALPTIARAQLDLFSKEQRIEFTPEWHGERFQDGRPNVPDSVLSRFKNVTAE